MTINDIHPLDIANQRKRVSDAVNDTDELYFKSNRRPSSHGLAANKVRTISDNAEIERLESATEEDYFNLLLEDD